MIVEVPRRLLWRVALGVLLPTLLLVGWLTSPKGAEGRPLLLSPSVRTVERYRRDARAWLAEFDEVDAALERLLASGLTDPFRQSTLGERVFTDIAALAEDIDRTQAPPALVSLRQQLHAAALAYLNAGRAALQWVSAPSEDNLTAVQEALDAARHQRETLATNEWTR